MKNDEESLLFASVSLTYFIHATEDAERVKKKVARRLMLDATDFSERALQGYYGNAIISVSAHVTGQRAGALASVIATNLEPNSRSQLRSELQSHVDEHDSLFLRLDKEEIMANDDRGFVTGAEESIRVKIKPKRRWGNREEMLKKYNRWLAGAT